MGLMNLVALRARIRKTAWGDVLRQGGSRTVRLATPKTKSTCRRTISPNAARPRTSRTARAHTATATPRHLAGGEGHLTGNVQWIAGCDLKKMRHRGTERQRFHRAVLGSMRDSFDAVFEELTLKLMISPNLQPVALR